MKVSVQNMTGRTGREVANQFIVTIEQGEKLTIVFQSYSSVIVKEVYGGGKKKVYLDTNDWDYSVTTSKYRNEFLGEDKAATQAKIDSGEYKLADLN